MIIGLHHAQITIACGAEDEARAFYCGVLGLPETPKPQSLLARGGVWLSVSTQSVHVGTEDGVDRLKTKAHVAYEVSDMAQWRAILAARGVEILDGVPIPGYERIEFRDPFGNQGELIQRIAE